MAEYIEREALINWAKEFYPNDKHFVSGIVNAPTADVAEVRRGKWIYGEFDIPYCSECGYGVMPNMMSPYCPNCGARMDGGNNNA